MTYLDQIIIQIEGKGVYENSLDENGKELEWLNGVGLTDGHYCKHYRWARDLSDKKHVDRNGVPLCRHYCDKSKKFGGWSYCCWTGIDCFEKGKSAGVKRIRNKIRKRRILGERP